MSDEKVSDDKGFVKMITSPIVLSYDFSAGSATSRFLREMKNGRIFGQRSSATGKIIIPPRGSDPETGTPTTLDVELSQRGTVISFTVVHLPIPGNPIEPPYIIANIVLDGADQSFIQLVSECDNDSVQMGSRVEAVWKDQAEWDYSFENIKYFRPIDEPLMDIDRLRAERQAAAAAWVDANGSEQQ
jgi:uncharacterized OB-fold protein